MAKYILLGILIILIVIIYQDLKYRVLDLKYAVILLLLCIWYNSIHPILDYKNTFLITGFILVNVMCLTLYFSAKKRQFINPIDSKIGLGDIVFFVVIAPLFYLKAYILFFITGLLFSLLLYGVVIRFREKQKTIPLAGYLSIYLGLILLSNTIFNTTIFNLGI
ncbi:hypothetical protein [Dokdonia sp.]|uniref:hypothetical protein n=1 Tax=Dokdonia sp. TaxID=2024995 RepID=UPI003265BF34